MSSGEIIFQFTRHAASCNNENAGEKVFLGKDFEPSLTDNGIFNTLKYVLEPERRNDSSDIFEPFVEGSGKDKISFDSNGVIVSNLLRTWCTATILYGVKDTEPAVNDELHLYVCPYLKEFHKDYVPFGKRGNYSKVIQNTVQRYINFLNYLHKKYQLPRNSVTTESLPDFFLMKNIVLHFIDNSISKTRINRNVTVKLGGNVTNKPYTIKDEDGTSKELIVKISYNNSEKQYDNIEIEENLPLFDITKTDMFTKNGNILLFMNWLYTNYSTYFKQISEQETGKPVYTKKNYEFRVHVVCHSNLMREYALSVLGKEKEDDIKNRISGTNCNTILTNINGSIFDIVGGYPNSKGINKNEKENIRSNYNDIMNDYKTGFKTFKKDTSDQNVYKEVNMLCAKSGSVDDRLTSVPSSKPELGDVYGTDVYGKTKKNEFNGENPLLKKNPSGKPNGNQIDISLQQAHV